MKKLLSLIVLAIWPMSLSADVLNQAPKADVLILGEVHDNLLHHANQATAVRLFAPRALVFEMLTRPQAGRVMIPTRQDAEQLQELLEWESRGWPDFNMYFPIFQAAPRAEIYGGAMERDVVRRAVTDGAAAAFGPGAARFQLDQPLPEDEREKRQQGQFEAHCNALPEHLLPGMVEAQRLRDAALAEAVLEALAETGGPVAVIAGTGHARRDWGVPAALHRADPGVTVFSLGQSESDQIEAALFDQLIVTDPVDRPDPCAAFTNDGG